ncbi:DUF3566 domain-containing protein [Amycolatopsis minnesotensis]|uniref:DUF3566 domain-containing protein n=1 Tax=Amycolatopsis minnesotensis TaxID=337894 RepID=A0ABN2RBF0_9PSEU
MTPPENPERGGSTSAAGADTPPWQRLGKDTEAGAGNGAPAGGIGTDAWSGGPPQAAEQPVVTGTAAPRLFGDGPAVEGETPRADGKAKRPAPTALRRPGRGPRRASLQIKRFDPWSVLKLSLVLGVAMFFVWLVAVGVLYTVLDGMGVWDKLNGTYSSLVSGEGGNAPSESLISAGRVFGIAAILGAINIVLVSALATVSAFIYNVSADLAGGLEVTLSERE